ncbi:beta-propeller fold lactonase family protein [Ahniella affigens]|uniref:beta-propeller fold lactonase family protein n=1 Tax=Ahniella affigens TaxID=2021234 RepID=UPI000D12C6BD|nr:beta-propeller fold lactonase family protein [Ahniella affigens]
MKRPNSSRTTAGLVALAMLLTTSAAFAQNAWLNWESPHVHPLDLSPDQTRLLAVNTADQRLQIFTVDAGGNLSAAGTVRVGVEPVSVRFRTANEAWVINHLSDSISIVDLNAGRVIRTILTGDEPADVVFAGTPERAYVSMSQLNQVHVYNPLSLATAPTVLPIQGEEPRALARSADGSRVYVALFESGNTSTIIDFPVVSNASGPYGGQNPPPNVGTTFDPPIAGGLDTPPPVAQIVRRSADGRFRDGNSRDWTNFVTWNFHDHDVAIIDTSNNSLSYANGLMTTVMAIGVAPDGRVLTVGTEATNEQRFEPKVKAKFVRVRTGSFPAANPANTLIADLNPHLDYQSTFLDPTAREQSLGDPRGVAFNADGTAWVSGMGSNNLIKTDATGTRLARIDVGQGPTGLALNAAVNRLYVLNKFDASISVVDTNTNQEASRLSFFDPTSTAVRLGRPMLYDTHAGSGLGQTACAGCHVDARTDFLAWDLGDPSGAMKTVNQTCVQGPGNCRPWHPMKGPLVTQSLQGIVGTEPLHWRGDRENLAAFAPAFVGLQGLDAQPNATAMQQFSDFIATVRYPPNPFRNLDNTMPTSIPVSNGQTGNPNTGQTIFQTQPVLPGGATCQTCHAGPAGTTRRIDDPQLAAAPQAMKQAQLRGMYEKVGWSIGSQNNSKGFGFNSNSDFDNLNALLSVGFNFGPPQQAVTARRDVEAFMIAFDNGTHAAIGQQVSFDGSNNADANTLARLSTLQTLANAGTIGLIAERNVAGVSRGYVYITQGFMLADRENDFVDLTALRDAATAASVVTFTAVGARTAYRAGVDRDSDGFLDWNETNAGSSPDNAASLPSNACLADYNLDGTYTQADVDAFTVAFNATSPKANFNHSLDPTTALPTVNAADQTAFTAAFNAGCTTLSNTLFANDFE